jgi:hypothetical protein
MAEALPVANAPIAAAANKLIVTVFTIKSPEG